MALCGSALLGIACGVDSDPLFSAATPLGGVGGGPGNLPIYAPPPVVGASGNERNGIGEGAIPVGTAQQRQDESDAGPDGGTPAPADAGPDGGVRCQLAADCLDDNACTLDDCVQGSCQHTPASAGSACGSATENACTHADSCDGAGHCIPNDAPAQTPCGRTDNSCAADRCDGAGACVTRDLAAGTACGSSSGCGQPTCSAGAVCQPHDAANGSACPGGSCSVGTCVTGQRVGCPRAVVTAVPFQTDWSSVGQPDLFQGSCENNNSNAPDFAVEFIVPAAGRYRFDASGSPDSVLILSRGACSAANGTELDCNDDISNGNQDSRLEAALTAGQTLTVYVSEFGTRNTGSGTLRITAL